MTGHAKLVVSLQIAMMAAVLAVCSQIAIPLPAGIPVTMQTLAVSLTGFLLGRKDGTVSVAVYLAMGCMGIPVFTQFRSGPGVIAGVTGGFLLGFLLLAFFCGLAGTGDRRKHRLRRVVCCCCGCIFCHALGVVWFSVVSGNTLAESFCIASLPYLAKDAASIAFAEFLARRLGNGVFRQNIQRDVKKKT